MKKKSISQRIFEEYPDIVQTYDRDTKKFLCIPAKDKITLIRQGLLSFWRSSHLQIAPKGCGELDFELSSKEEGDFKTERLTSEKIIMTSSGFQILLLKVKVENLTLALQGKRVCRLLVVSITCLMVTKKQSILMRSGERSFSASTP